MKAFALFLIAIILLNAVILVCGKKFVPPSGESTGEERLALLRSLQASSSNGLITLDNESYEYFVLDQPREYSLMVFLTAMNPRYKCLVCKDVEDHINKVSKQFHRSSNLDDNTFFVKLDFEKGGKTFMAYEMNTVPVLFYVDQKSGIGNEKSEYIIPSKDRFPFPETTTADTIAEWVTYKTGVQVIFEKSAIMAYIMTIVCFGGIAALVPRIINSLDTFWLPIAQSKKLWGFVSVIIYTCSISGLIFDIIRNPPWYHRNPRDGSMMFFYPQSQQQFVVEGFIIGALNVGCTASLLFTVLMAPKLETPEKRTLGILGGCLSFAMFFWQVKGLYVMKNRWYGTDM